VSETYTCDDMVCCKCKHKYALTFVADTYSEAMKLIREMNYGSFNAKTQIFVEPTPCKNCLGSRLEELTASEYSQPTPFKAKLVMIQKNGRWKHITRDEAQATSWDKALTEVRAESNTALINGYANRVQDSKDWQIACVMMRLAYQVLYLNQ
jgi:hypothetical protein